MLSRQLRRAAALGGGVLAKRGVVTVSPEVTTFLNTTTTKVSLSKPSAFLSLITCFLAVWERRERSSSVFRLRVWGQTCKAQVSCANTWKLENIKRELSSQYPLFAGGTWRPRRWRPVCSPRSTMWPTSPTLSTARWAGGGDDGDDDDDDVIDGQALRSRCWTRRQGNDYFIPCWRGTSSAKVLSTRFKWFEKNSNHMQELWGECSVHRLEERQLLQSYQGCH